MKNYKISPSEKEGKKEEEEEKLQQEPPYFHTSWRRTRYTSSCGRLRILILDAIN